MTQASSGHREKSMCANWYFTLRCVPTSEKGPHTPCFPAPPKRPFPPFLVFCSDWLTATPLSRRRSTYDSCGGLRASSVQAITPTVVWHSQVTFGIRLSPATRASRLHYRVNTRLHHRSGGLSGRYVHAADAVIETRRLFPRPSNPIVLQTPHAGQCQRVPSS